MAIFQPLLVISTGQPQAWNPGAAEATKTRRLKFRRIPVGFSVQNGSKLFQGKRAVGCDKARRFDLLNITGPQIPGLRVTQPQRIHLADHVCQWRVIPIRMFTTLGLGKVKLFRNTLSIFAGGFHAAFAAKGVSII